MQELQTLKVVDLQQLLLRLRPEGNSLDERPEVIDLLLELGHEAESRH